MLACACGGVIGFVTADGAIYFYVETLNHNASGTNAWDMRQNVDISAKLTTNSPDRGVFQNCPIDKMETQPLFQNNLQSYLTYFKFSLFGELAG